MSFSSDVKAELAKQCKKSRHCQLAELAGILELAGRERGGILTLDSENPCLLQKYALLMRRLFSIEAEQPLSREDSQRVLAALKWEDAVFEKEAADGLLLLQACCRRAFIRGAFMAAGSISDPSKSYHFEIVCRTKPQALQLQSLMAGFSAEAGIVERKGHPVLYLKEGSQIVDMLNVMEASVSLMNLENIRILKEMRNSVNRKVNCETANIHKTVDAAVRQLEDIRRIQETRGLSSLPESLQEVARLRLEYPDATLAELGARLLPPVGKSGVNHRLHRISDIAAEL
ncbi:MAG: DNA-binding protein WhiA [Muribaculaceae bacterium]|nr:DNA-binding protein WhiA [Roseburia sp.]MCM1430199.1 DNA-binding protein WhiA [Muribaculaceae bacterium]MCM1493129.1 DNA-binding protein WhiA [Muribaculaceae bacterium]